MGEGVREWEEKFAELGPLVFGLHDGQSEAPKIMAKKVRDFYLGPTPLEPTAPEGLVNAISDSSYAHPVDTAAKVHALKSAAPVFVYHFGYHGKHSQTHVKPNEFPQVLSAPDTHYGVGNGDDLMYLFPMMMDQGLPNHQRMAFWGGMPVYWNADRSNYAPAP